MRTLMKLNAATLAVGLLFSCAWAQVSSKPTNNASSGTSSQPAMPMASTAPLFIENQSFSSTIHVVNESINAGSIDLTLFDLSGNQIASVQKYLPAVSQRSFDVKSLLQSSGLYAAVGSVRLAPMPSPKPIAILAQVSITDQYENQAGAHAYLDEEFAMPMTMGSNILRGVAEASPQSTIIALSGTGSKLLHVTVNCAAAHVPSLSRAILVKPNETKLIRPCINAQNAQIEDLSELDSAPSAETADGTDQNPHALGISVISDGGPGDLAAYGLQSRHSVKGLDLDSIVFIDPASLRSSGLVFAGIPVGQTSQLNANFGVQIAVSNFSSKPAHVSVLLAKDDGETAAAQTIQQFVLSGNNSQDVRLDNIQSDPNMGNSFIVRSDAAPGDVISQLVARGRSSSAYVETPAKDENQQNNSGGHPWSIENGTTSTLFLFNHDAKAQTVTVRIGSNGVKWQKAYPIQPMQTLEIDVGTLIHQGIVDDHGKTLPPALTAGEIGWVAPEPHFTGRLMQFNDATQIARNFSCGEIEYLCAAEFDDPDLLALFVNETGDLGDAIAELCLAESEPCDCKVGDNSEIGTMSSGLTDTFSSGNTSILSLQSSSGASSTWKGVAVGSATANVDLFSPTLGDCEGGAPATVQQLGSFGIAVTNANDSNLSQQANGVVAGTAAQLKVTAYDTLGALMTSYTGTVSFSSSDTLAILPASYAFTASDAGVHSFSATLKSVNGLSSTSGITVTDKSANVSGTENAYVWFHAFMDVERWKNCGFKSCPNAGSYYCATAYNPKGYSSPQSFIAVTASSKQLAGQGIEILTNSTNATASSIEDAGPHLGYPYWNNAVYPNPAGCVSDQLANNLGIANGCNPGPYGSSYVYWRFQ